MAERPAAVPEPTVDPDAIAAALGCRRGTVRSLLSRGLSTLRAQTDPGVIS